MRSIYILKKCVKEIVRDWKVLFFSLIFGPAFIFIFHSFYSNTQPVYKVAVTNFDKGFVDKQNTSINAGEELIKILNESKNSDGIKAYKVQVIKDKDEAMQKLKMGKYNIYISIPKEFSKSIGDQANAISKASTKLMFYGDMTTNEYMLSAITISGIGDKLVSSLTGRPRALNYVEKSIVPSKERTAFEMSIPAGVLLGIIMLVFTSAIALVKEIEAGTIRRLQISKVSAKELLAAITASQLFIGMVSIALTFFTAMTIFRAKSEGAMWLVWLIAILCCISIIAVGFILAGFSRNVSEILILGNLPYFILFLFSGVFPIPRLNIFSIGSHSIAVNDIFPTTPAMTAMKMVMDQGKNLNDIWFELVLILVLTGIYFAVGIYLFNRRHMKLS